MTDEHDAHPNGLRPERRRRVARVALVVYSVVLASWVVMPMVWRSGEPSDAIAYVAAVRQASERPNAIYAQPLAHWSDVTPAYRKNWCAMADVERSEACHGNAYLASPIALAPSWLVSLGGRRAGIDVFRLLAACSLIAGMAMIWAMLAERSPRAPQLLALTAIASTPLALKTVATGQTSPLLFLAVCLGIAGLARRRDAAAVVSWVAGTAFKTSPVAIGLVLIWRRRWRLLGYALASFGVLIGLSLVFVPSRTWRAYGQVSRQLDAAAWSIPHNFSLTALVGSLGGGHLSILGVGLPTLVAVAIGFIFCAWTMRGASDNGCWALGHVAWLLASPLVWSHYLWILVAALAVLCAERVDLDDKVVGLVPGVALLSGAPVIFGAENTFGNWALPLPLSAAFWDAYRPIALGVCAIGIGFVARTNRRPAGSSPRPAAEHRES